MPKPRTAPVYRFIQRYLKEHGYPPGLDEIADGCGLSVPQVQTCLEHLESAGRLTFRPDRPRGLRLTAQH